MSGISFRKSDCKCISCLFLMNASTTINKDGHKRTKIYCMIPNCIRAKESTEGAFFNAENKEENEK